MSAAGGVYAAPRVPAALLHSHQSVLGIGGLWPRLSPAGRQERARRPGTAGRGPRGDYGNRWGATSAPAAGVSLSLLRGGVAPQAYRRLKAPGSHLPGADCRPLQAWTIQTTKSVSVPCSAGSSPRPGLRGDSQAASARPPPAHPSTPRGDLAAEIEHASHARAAQLSGLQTDSGPRPTEPRLGKRKPPSLPAPVTNPRSPPNSQRVMAVLSVAGHIPAQPGGASAQSSAPLRGRGAVSLCLCSEPHNHGNRGPASRVLGRRHRTLVSAGDSDENAAGWGVRAGFPDPAPRPALSWSLWSSRLGRDESWGRWR